jgi:hypothetical protein
MIGNHGAGFDLLEGLDDTEGEDPCVKHACLDCIQHYIAKTSERKSSMTKAKKFIHIDTLI